MNLRAILFWAALASAAAVSCIDRDAPSRPSYPGAKDVALSRIEFEDGDTIELDGEPVRILGVDTPETRSPKVGIMIDQPYGPAAAESTRALLTRARRIEIALDGRGAYGRRLGHVFVDGELLAVKLIEMGLAYENVSHFGDNGFPDLADRILDAAADAPKPPFQQPYRWRKKNQKRQP